MLLFLQAEYAGSDIITDHWYKVKLLQEYLPPPPAPYSLTPTIDARVDNRGIPAITVLTMQCPLPIPAEG